MKTKYIILVLCIASFTTFSYAKAPKQTLLRDGIVLRGAAGKLIASDSNDDKWFFEFSSPVTENTQVIEAGKKIELLPSSSLEMMIDNAKTHLPATYQLWNAKVTKYEGKNYLFLSAFIPIHPVSKTDNSDKSEPNESSSTKVNEEGYDSIDSNDILSFPTDILDQFNQAKESMEQTGQRIPDSNFVTIDDFQKELDRKRKLNPDTVLLEENAIFVRDNKNGSKFKLDTIGRNVDSTSLRLLSNETLEQVELKQASSPEVLRFKISGIVTKYKGNNYLLLYKATQTYSFGNLGR